MKALISAYTSLNSHPQIDQVIQQIQADSHDKKLPAEEIVKRIYYADASNLN